MGLGLGRQKRSTHRQAGSGKPIWERAEEEKPVVRTRVGSG